MNARGDGVRHDVSLLSDDDLFLFNEGSHFALWEKLGAHPTIAGGRGRRLLRGLGAQTPRRVSVCGDFNGWNKESHRLAARGTSGIWEGFIPGVGKGALYKYHVRSRFFGLPRRQGRPVRRSTTRLPPRTGSVVWDLDYAWNDAEWMARRGATVRLDAPMSDLRGAPRFLDAGARGRQPVALVPGAGAAARRVRARRWGSPTSSSCR